MDKPKVLLTYIESGMGHIMSMRAVADSLKKNYSDKLDLVETEIMRDTNSREQIWFENFLTAQTKLTNKVSIFGPAVFFLMEIGKQGFMRFVHHTLFRQATRATVEAFKTHNPDVIVSTHYFITFAAIEYKRLYNPKVIVASYNPDNNVHVWWDNRSDLFITNNSGATKEAIYNRDFNADAVKQVFFSARQEVVDANESKECYRKKYGIPLDKFAVIVADGAYADGKGKDYADFLLTTDSPLTVVMLAGKNKKVFDYFSKKVEKVKSNVTLIPMEFTDKAYEVYAACDLFISKSGPNALLDSLFMQTPVMVNYCPHPIEKATYQLFVEKLGCGVGAFDKRTAKRLVENYVEDPTLLDGYRENIAKRLDKHRNGADQVAKIIYEAAYPDEQKG